MGTEWNLAQLIQHLGDGELLIAALPSAAADLPGLLCGFCRLRDVPDCCPAQAALEKIGLCEHYDLDYNNPDRVKQLFEELKKK